MTDDLEKRRMAKQRDSIADARARAALNARAKELRPHGAAIVELLHAAALVAERAAGHRVTDVGLVYGVAGALGVNNAQQMEILEQLTLTGGNETE